MKVKRSKSEEGYDIIPARETLSYEGQVASMVLHLPIVYEFSYSRNSSSLLTLRTLIKYIRWVNTTIIFVLKSFYCYIYT